MVTFLNSGNAEIISSGSVYLFSNPGDLEIKISDSYLDIDLTIRIEFLEDEGVSKFRRVERVESEIINGVYSLKYYNPRISGMPYIQEISEIGGRKIYLTFRTSLDGRNNPGVRYVSYSLYFESGE